MSKTERGIIRHTAAAAKDAVFDLPRLSKFAGSTSLAAVGGGIYAGIEDRPILVVSFGAAALSLGSRPAIEMYSKFKKRFSSSLDRYQKPSEEKLAAYDQFAPLREAQAAMPHLYTQELHDKMAPELAPVEDQMHNYLTTLAPHLPESVCLEEGRVKGERGMSIGKVGSMVGIFINEPKDSVYFLSDTQEIVTIHPTVKVGKHTTADISSDRYPDDENFIGFESLRAMPEATFQSAEAYVEQDQNRYGASGVHHTYFVDRIAHHVDQETLQSDEAVSAKTGFDTAVEEFQRKIESLEESYAPDVRAAAELLTDSIRNIYYGDDSLPEYVRVSQAGFYTDHFYLPRDIRLVFVAREHIDRSDWRNPIPDVTQGREATDLEWARHGTDIPYELVNAMVSSDDRTYMHVVEGSKLDKLLKNRKKKSKKQK